MAHKKQNDKITELPSVEQVSSERERLRHGSRFRHTLNSTIAILIVVAAAAILVATLWLPVLQIYGTSMTPMLEDGEIVVLVKNSDFDTGDVVAFYYNNKILVKRVICGPGDWINIDQDGSVTVNDKKLDEPYISDKSLGECDLTFPYQVPDEAFFVMGDHRSVSIDSRSSLVGCVRSEQIVGRVVLRVWPITRFTFIS